MGQIKPREVCRARRTSAGLTLLGLPLTAVFGILPARAQFALTEPLAEVNGQAITIKGGRVRLLFFRCSGFPVKRGSEIAPPRRPSTPLRTGAGRGENRIKIAS